MSLPRAGGLIASATVLCGVLSGAAVFVSPAAPSAPSPCAAASHPHHAAVVVEHGDGRTVRACVGFDGSGIGGEQALRASGIAYQAVGYASLGEAVCQVDGEPSTYPATCWTGTSPYWVLFTANRGGAWVSSDVGIAGVTLRDGDAEGLRYDPQSGAPAPPPSAAGACPGGGVPVAASATPSPRVAAVLPASSRGPGSSSPALGFVAASIAAAALGVTLALQLLRRRRTGP